MKKKIIAFIPVRGGSRSIPFKNIKKIAGKPLVHWVVDAAIKCKEINEVWISTDSNKIEEVVRKIDSTRLFVHRRSQESATDFASTESVMIEFAEGHNFSDIILIQATSPLLMSSDLSLAIHKYIETCSDSLISVVRQKRFIWKEQNEVVISENYDYFNRPRRQDFDGYLVENGAFYITSRINLLKSRSRISGRIIPYIMGEETYYELDEPTDWTIVEALLRKREEIYRNVGRKRIKLVLMDVDGVLTDGGMYYSENGDEQKKFNTRDGKGVELLINAGIKTGIITSEDTKIVRQRAAKLKIDYLFQGALNKLEIARAICTKEKIELDEVAYIGDDINDVLLLEAVGLKACPGDAEDDVKEIPGMHILDRKGGHGAFREFVHHIIG